MPDLKLWYTPSACSLAPHILLHEAELPFEPVAVSIADGENLQERFLSLNPKGRVPVLSVDGEVITEVPAIATAISDLSPDHGLMGQTPLERAHVYEWMNWLSGTVHTQGFGGLWRASRFSDDEGALDGIRAKGRQTIANSFAVIEGKLTTLHAVADRFTAVDPYLLVFFRWGNMIGLNMSEEYPRYAALAGHLSKHPSVQRAIATEQIDPLGQGARIG